MPQPRTPKAAATTAAPSPFPAVFTVEPDGRLVLVDEGILSTEATTDVGLDYLASLVEDPTTVPVGWDGATASQLAELAIAERDRRVALAGAGRGFVLRLADAMTAAGAVTKSSTNVDQGYKFASAEAILEAVRLPLLTRGIVLTQTPASYVDTEITSRNNAKGSLITAVIDFTFVDGHSDQTLRIPGWRGQGQDYGDKALGKAYTNAVKTFIRAQWLLPTGDDPEGSDPGERIAPNSRAADLPVWAVEATAERRTEWVDALEPLLGRRGAGLAAKSLVTAWGTFPDGAVAIAKVIGTAATTAIGDDLIAAIAEHRAEAAAKAAAIAAQEAAAEAPDPPAPDGPSQEEVDAELIARAEAEEAAAKSAGAGAPTATPATSTADVDVVPGTVELPDVVRDETATGVAKIEALRAAGCICNDPLNPGQEGAIDDACPVNGHGIPF